MVQDTWWLELLVALWVHLQLGDGKEWESLETTLRNAAAAGLPGNHGSRFM